MKWNANIFLICLDPFKWEYGWKSRRVCFCNKNTFMFLLITRRVQQKIVSGPNTFLRDNDLGTYQEWTLLPNIYDNTYPLLNLWHYKAYSLFLSITKTCLSKTITTDKSYPKVIKNSCGSVMYIKWLKSICAFLSCKPCDVS